MERIIELLIWPITIIIVVKILQSPLSKLIPTLTRLKYGELELEFEREAKKILADTERDIPETEKPSKAPGKSDVLYSKSASEPAVEIMGAWRNLEISLRKIADSNGITFAKSTRSLVASLANNGLIETEAANLILNLASLRNKIAHTNEILISRETANSYVQSVRRIENNLSKTDA